MFKLIDCDTGISKDDYKSPEAALDAARRMGLRDYEVHDATGKCLYWKLPGDIIPNETER
jgi:hypothetical protein